MYKVLIIDDEYYIRQRLKTCIEWEEEGLRLQQRLPMQKKHSLPWKKEALIWPWWTFPCRRRTA